MRRWTFGATRSIPEARYCARRFANRSGQSSSGCTQRCGRGHRRGARASGSCLKIRGRYAGYLMPTTSFIRHPRPQLSGATDPSRVRYAHTMPAGRLGIERGGEGFCIRRLRRRAAGRESVPHPHPAQCRRTVVPRPCADAISWSGAAHQLQQSSLVFTGNRRCLHRHQCQPHGGVQSTWKPP